MSASSAPNRATVRLVEASEQTALVEAVARRVVELLRHEGLAGSRLVDAAELAAVLGITAETVRAHADELGVVRIGDGARPRLRFDVETARSAWTARSVRERSDATDRPSTAKRAGRPRAQREQGADLLPIRGREAA